MNHTDKERAYRKALLRGAGRCVTRVLPDAAKSELLNEAKRCGYDTDKLLWVRPE